MYWKNIQFGLPNTSLISSGHLINIERLSLNGRTWELLGIKSRLKAKELKSKRGMRVNSKTSLRKLFREGKIRVEIKTYTIDGGTRKDDIWWMSKE